MSASRFRSRPPATIAAWSPWVPASTYFTASLAPSLSISSTHQGYFVQGQTGAVYVVTVGNAAGAAPASGLVTATETLPAGLTLISMQSAGWSCSANVCTCADGLNAGQTYPPITVTVNVSTNAALLTNTVSVSGGGAPTAVASDPTIITLTGSLPSTTLLSSVSGAFFGRQVALTAGVTSGATGTVAFYDGATILGVRAVTGGQAVLTTSLLPAGRRSLWARYNSDPTYAASNSVVLGVIVTPAAANGFGPAVTVSMGGYSAAVIVGDFNADGKPDLAAANYVANNVQVLLGLGNGAFQNPVFYAAGSAPWSIAAGDFNGDGKTDLVAANTNGNNVSVLLGNGNGTFQPALNYGVGSSNPKSVAVGREGRPGRFRSLSRHRDGQRQRNLPGARNDRFHGKHCDGRAGGLQRRRQAGC